MKRLVTLTLLLTTLLFGATQHKYADAKTLSSGVTIIDIRTPAEWKETGIVKGSVPITFFDEKGAYNVPQFLQELKKHIKPNETFALICRTGSRTKVVSEFLGKNGYNVINLIGGIVYAKSSGVKLTPYNP